MKTINYTGQEFYELFFDPLWENNNFEVSKEALSKINKFWKK